MSECASRQRERYVPVAHREEQHSYERACVAILREQIDDLDAFDVERRIFERGGKYHEKGVESAEREPCKQQIEKIIEGFEDEGDLPQSGMLL